MATRVTIQDIANELQLSRNTVSKAINNTGVLADATREKILRTSSSPICRCSSLTALRPPKRRPPPPPMRPSRTASGRSPC